MSSLSAAFRRGVVLAAAALAACNTDPTSAPEARGAGPVAFAKIPATKIAISSLMFVPDTLVGGGGTLGFIGLSAPAPVGGAVVSLVSSDTAAVKVPATVTVPQGQTGVRFDPPATGSSWTSRTPTVTASYNRASVSTKLYLLPTDLAVLRVAADTIPGGGSTRLDVMLNANAPAGGAYVDLVADPASAISIPQTIFIPAGSGGIGMTIFANAGGSVRITASLNRALTPATTSQTILTTSLYVQ